MEFLAMRVSREEKDRSHQRIVAGASRLLREKGVGATSVGDVMSEAGLTHGGFYRHFGSKDALVAAAIRSGFDEIRASIEARFEKRDPGHAVADYLSFYLSDDHVNHRELGCPVAALAGDVARESEALKVEFGAGVGRIIETLAKGMEGTKRERRESAVREIAMRIGAVALARASDPETAGFVLSACRRKL